MSSSLLDEFVTLAHGKAHLIAAIQGKAPLPPSVVEAMSAAADRAFPDMGGLFVHELLKGEIAHVCFRNAAPIVRFLIDEAHVDVQRVGGDGSGALALQSAAMNGAVDIMQLLLSRGASTTAKEKRGGVALDAAAVGGEPEAVKCLLAAGCDPRHTNEQGRTALQLCLAVHRGSWPPQSPGEEALLFVSSLCDPIARPFQVTTKWRGCFQRPPVCVSSKQLAALVARTLSPIVWRG
jgi:hypothetical protein